MGRLGCALLLAACLALPASASAALPKRCEGGLAVICDPAGHGGARFSIEADGGRASGKARTGIARLRGRERLRTGERIRFDLTGASAATIAAFDVETRDGAREVVVKPFRPRAQRYEVELGDAVARVNTDDGRTRSIRFLPRPPVMSNATQSEAVRSFVRLISDEHYAAIEAACRLLSSDARAAFGSDELCAGWLGFILFDREGEPSYPEPLRSIEVRRVRLVRGHPDIARARVAYRFPKRTARVWATVPLAREPDGWHIAVPNQLSPTEVVRHHTDLTVREVQALLRRYRRAAADARAEQLRRAAATAAIQTGSTACRGQVRAAADPARDVEIGSVGDHARRQDQSGVDLIGASQSQSGGRLCFELRFRTPLAEQAGVDLRLTQRGADDELRVELDGNGAVAIRDVNDDPTFLAPGVVRVSPARDALSIEIEGSTGWPYIDLTRGYGWAVDALSLLATRDDVYLDELKP